MEEYLGNELKRLLGEREKGMKRLEAPAAETRRGQDTMLRIDGAITANAQVLEQLKSQQPTETSEA